MSTVTVPDNQVFEQSPGRNFADELRSSTVAVAIRTKALYTTRRLTEEQSRQQAETFHAQPEFVSGSKRLLNTKHPLYKAVSRVINEFRQHWVGNTMPFPDAGVRLLKLGQEGYEARVARYLEEVEQYRTDLDQAVAELDSIYRAELIPAAERALGDLFDPSDYPQSLRGLWSIDVDFPSVEPDDRLKEINPELYEKERQKVEARFREAVELTEQALAEELRKVVQTLVDRLSPQEVAVYLKGETIAERRNNKVVVEYADDTPTERHTFDDGEDAREYLHEQGFEFQRTRLEEKSFRASTVTNLSKFFERFADLNIGSSQQLEQVVADAQAAVAGISVKGLRDANVAQRQAILDPIATVADRIEGLLVDRTQRSISFDDV